jgi:hypothetical protein
VSILDALVLDASAWINVLGTGADHAILSALDRPKVVVEVTSAELHRHPLQPARGEHPLEPHVASGSVIRSELSGNAWSTFYSLVGADPTDDLDDGEAATLAYAHHFNGVAVIDERKARRVASMRFPELELWSSVDIFRRPEVCDALGAKLGEAVFSALVNARMRVFARDQEWVENIVGKDRARECPSLRRRGRG